MQFWCTKDPNLDLCEELQMDFTVSFLKGLPVCFMLALLEANAWISKSVLLV